jgi:hypothetical protein
MFFNVSIGVLPAWTEAMLAPRRIRRYITVCANEWSQGRMSSEQ